MEHRGQSNTKQANGKGGHDLHSIDCGNCFLELVVGIAGGNCVQFFGTFDGILMGSAAMTCSFS